MHRRSGWPWGGHVPGGWLVAEASSHSPAVTASQAVPSSVAGDAPSWPRLVYDTVETLDGLEALAPAWRALLNDRQFFVGPDWVIEWLRWRESTCTPFAVVARDAVGRLMGLLPLARSRRGALSVCGGQEGAAHVDVVAQAGFHPAVAAGVLDRLGGLRRPKLRFHRLAADGALARLLASRPADAPLLDRVGTACPFVEQRGDWLSFLRDLSKHQRHEATRQLRRFWERPGASLRWVTTRDGVAEGLAVLFDLHERRFAAIGKATVFHGSDLLRFHLALAERLVDRDALMLGVLCDGARPVAAAYGFHQGGTTLFFQSGVDPEFQATGAGVVLRGHVMKDACLGAGRHELDLLDGCQDWKLRWATGVRPLVDVDLFPATLAGRARERVERAVRSLRARAAEAVRGRPDPGCASGYLAAPSSSSNPSTGAAPAD